MKALIKKNRLILILLFAVSEGVNASKLYVPQSSDANHPRLAYTQNQINFVAAKIDVQAEPWYSAYTKFITLADSYSARTHAASSDFHTPAYYSNPNENIKAKEGLALDAHAAHANALAYALTENEQYAQKAIYFLNAWASINKTITENNQQGEATGTILTAANLMPGFLIAADLLLGHVVWNENDKAVFKAWVQNVFLPNVGTIKTKSNNWGDWGAYAVSSSYHILGDNTKLRVEIDRLKARIDKHQNEDASMPQETRREANGLWYTYFALTPITLHAQLAYNTTGQDIFNWTSENGRSIKKALDYLEYYELNKSEWPWHPMPNTSPNKDAPSDLFEAMNDFYNNEYDSFVTNFRPVSGGYKGTRVSHLGWSFPTLMRMSGTTTSVNITNPSADNISVYPNPVQENAVIVANGTMSGNAVLYNLYGNKVKTLHVGDKNTLDLSGIPSGCYLLQINNSLLKVLKI